MASPTPVLPLVGSTMVPPGFSSPLCSAASIMRRAMRSFTDPPGLKYSTLARTVAWMPAVTLLSLTSGVLPTRLIIESWNCTVVSGCCKRSGRDWFRQPKARDGAGVWGLPPDSTAPSVEIGRRAVRGKEWMTATRRWRRRMTSMSRARVARRIAAGAAYGGGGVGLVGVAAIGLVLAEVRFVKRHV